MIVLILLFFMCSLYYFNFRRSRKALYEFSKKLPTIGELPLLGHTHWFFGGPEKILNNMQTLVRNMEKTGSVCKLWIGPNLYIVTLNPEDVQKILENCLEKDYSYKFLQAWLGNGLFVAPVDVWKAHRRLLLPIFHNRIIEDYIEVFGEQGDILVKRLQEQVVKPKFDVYEYITSCMLDIVFETAMGEKMDVQHDSDTPYLRARKTVMSIINMRLFKAWMQPDVIFNFTSYAGVQKESIDATHKFTDEVWTDKKHSAKKAAAAARRSASATGGGPSTAPSLSQWEHKIVSIMGDGFGEPQTSARSQAFIEHVIKKKKKAFKQLQHKEVRKDILQLLLERKLAFSNVELREHIDSITIAGNDTTALVISYALLLLGHHEDAQDKVYKELKSIFGDSLRSPTKEDLSKMEYLERVIKETMRLYTVVPIIGRKTNKELKLSSCTIPAGVGCAVVPMVIHRSKRIWGPDADCFNPDRFLPENHSSRHPCSYIPFSYGSRNCIGRHFGMLAMKSILANVLRSYEVSSEECCSLKIEILLFPVSGHLITLKKRV